MFLRKITRKLSLLISGSLILLVGIVIAAQFFVIGRMFFTTEYTKHREAALLDESQWFIEQYTDAIILGKNDKITGLLNKYAREGSVYCFILDKTCNIAYKSDNLSKLNRTYIDEIQKKFRQSEMLPEAESGFRLKGFLGIPSRYIMIYQPVYDNWYNASEKENMVYFVTVMKEVYTDDNYLVLLRYSVMLFIIVSFLVMSLGGAISYIVTRPILKIRDTTVRLVNLDFTQKCDYKANDEIGDLSNNLNYLSNKLNDTILQLKEVNEKLKSDLDIQREIDQFRKEFIATVSHEFKTPLTLIRGFTEIVTDNRVNAEEMQEAYCIIMDEVDRMDKFVADLLELSKLESDTYELHKMTFDCTELLDNIADKYSILLKDRRIKICCDFGDDNAWVCADKIKIEQVVMNFITNAILNTPENGTISLKSETQNGFIIISVYNEGSHIEETEIDKIWDKFYRVDKSRAKKTGGTGLGLTICKEILEKHESVYGAENTEKGVRFYFKLKIV